MNGPQNPQFSRPFEREDPEELPFLCPRLAFVVARHVSVGTIPETPFVSLLVPGATALVLLVWHSASRGERKNPWKGFHFEA